MLLLSDGIVYAAIPGLCHGHCKINPRNFPYDQHICFLLLGSSSESNIRMKKMFSNVVQQGGYMPANPEWTLLNTSSNVMNSTNGPISAIATHDLLNEEGKYLNMQGLQFTFSYRRAHLFPETILVVPIILIGLGSNTVFLIPPESDDRMGFLVTNILTMFVMLALIDQMLPRYIHVHVYES